MEERVGGGLTMLYDIHNYRNMFIPTFYDPFGSPIFTPKHRKLKGYQK